MCCKSFGIFHALEQNRFITSTPYFIQYCYQRDIFFDFDIIPFVNGMCCSAEKKYLNKTKPYQTTTKKADEKKNAKRKMVSYKHTFRWDKMMVQANEREIGVKKKHDIAL